MGREIRMVPANWQHPKDENGNHNRRTGQFEDKYTPLYDRPYLEELNEWIENHQLWEAGKHPDQDSDYRYYAEYSGNPPDVKYYRPDWKPEEMTWFQVYETVSEGTPVTPPFATKEELIEYLVKNGDFWDQKRRAEGSFMPCAPWSRETAEGFVNGPGWAPTFVVSEAGIQSGVEALGNGETGK